MSADLQPLRDLLFAGHKELPPAALDEARRLGAAAGPLLVDVLRDADLANDDARGGGWAPVHAAKLAGELKVVEAIEPLADIIEGLGYDTYLLNAAVFALVGIGAPAFEPVLARMSGSEADDFFLEVLSRIGVKDERLFRALLAFAETDVEMGAAYLATYGDARALPFLQEAFDGLVPEGDPLADHVFIELDHAIRELGGDLDAEQRAKLDEVHRTFDEARARRLHRKVGRNQPCPCGSGAKYKKCHGRPGSGALT